MGALDGALVDRERRLRLWGSAIQQLGAESTFGEGDSKRETPETQAIYESTTDVSLSPSPRHMACTWPESTTTIRWYRYKILVPGFEIPTTMTMTAMVVKTTTTAVCVSSKLCSLYSHQLLEGYP